MVNIGFILVKYQTSIAGNLFTTAVVTILCYSNLEISDICITVFNHNNCLLTILHARSIEQTSDIHQNRHGSTGSLQEM